MDNFKPANSIHKQSLSVEQIQSRIDDAVKNNECLVFYPILIYISDDIKLALLKAGYTLSTERQPYQVHGLTISW